VKGYGVAYKTYSLVPNAHSEISGLVGSTRHSTRYGSCVGGR